MKKREPGEIGLMTTDISPYGYPFQVPASIGSSLVSSRAIWFFLNCRSGIEIGSFEVGVRTQADRVARPRVYFFFICFIPS